MNSITDQVLRVYCRFISIKRTQRPHLKNICTRLRFTMSPKDLQNFILPSPKNTITISMMRWKKLRNGWRIRQGFNSRPHFRFKKSLQIHWQSILIISLFDSRMEVYYFDQEAMAH